VYCFCIFSIKLDLKQETSFYYTIRDFLELYTFGIVKSVSRIISTCLKEYSNIKTSPPYLKVKMQWNSRGLYYKTFYVVFYGFS
jgi:hypothetical protein